MLIRVAVAVSNRKTAQVLTNRMVSFSVRSVSRGEDIEFDFSYCPHLAAVLECAEKIDMSILSYEVLQEEPALLAMLYKSNPAAFSIPLGLPEGRVCDFLALRPAGHLRTPDDQAQIDRLCLWCAEGMLESGDVLQLKTRQGCQAITASSILFCQSDQKYVMIVTASGEIFRKLEKLDHLAALLPGYFLRVHQSYLVNTRRISGLDKTLWELRLDGGNRVPVSRAYQRIVADQFQNFPFSRQK